MIQRVMPELMGMKNIIVLNDEAHHCYRERADKSDEGDLKGVLAALLEAEINIHYVYSFIKRPEGRGALAINAEDTDVAAQSLSRRGFRVLTQAEISR